MLEPSSSLLVMLLLSHVVADFILPFKRVLTTSTFRPRVTWLCGLAGVHGVGVFLLMLLARPSVATAAWAGLGVGASWLAVSQSLPRLFEQPISRLLVEHVAHIAVLLSVWLTSERYWHEVLDWLGQWLSTRNLLLVLAYLLILRPASAVIGAALKPWLSAVTHQDSLKNA